MRLSAPALLIDINGVDGLDRIAAKADKIEIGALARHAQVEQSDIVAKKTPLIARAMPHGDILGFAPPLCLSEKEAAAMASDTIDR